ncbi:MAG: hypothetical protein MI974_08075 [Chitinophagales bacterium]|nr:hypothetical protein [Chitinophagales bacterium]
MKYHLLIFTFLSAAILSGCYYDNEEDLYQYVQQEDCTFTSATYSAEILPILTTHCIRCHRNGREDGNVNLEGYANAKVYADNGSLYGSANHEPGYSVMPTSGVKIPFCQLEQIRLWIADGAPNN